MLFTTSQVRAVLGLSSETLRYWRSSLVPLSSKPGGKAARFDIGEILALAVVAKLVSALRIDVGAIAPIAEQIFATCRRPMAIGSPTWLCIDVERNEVRVVTERVWLPDHATLVVVAISDMATAIKDALLQPGEAGAGQREFSWPLASVT